REKDAPTAKGDSGAIRVWDLARGRALTPLTGHTGPVTGLVVSADGKAALSSSADETVALWDLAQGRRASQSPKQPLRVLAAAVSPDAKRGLVAYPGLLVKTDLEKFQAAGQPIKSAQLPGLETPESVLAVAVSGDRKGLVGGLDGKLFVIDMTDKAKPKALSGLKEAVRTAAFSAVPAVAATGSGGVLRVGKVQPGRENAVCVWDTVTGLLKWRADEHTNPVVCVAFSADGRLLASGDERGEVRVWAVSDGRPLGTFGGHAGRVFALAFSPDGKALLSGSADKSVRTWRLP
ncbi:MAG TPA: WD40 repeat domain-containing protein, partial [Gemmataceae bacterium]|nr:WD40 repeat domain-containing protein [Gemmataceae bacterium]